jgi:hypothetical protein
MVFIDKLSPIKQTTEGTNGGRRGSRENSVYHRRMGVSALGSLTWFIGGKDAVPALLQRPSVIYQVGDHRV